MPGVGKTTIAIEMAYQMAPLFPDGVLWASLDHIGLGSSEQDDERLLACMYTFIQAYGRDPAEATTVESRAVILREVLQNKQALIIFDNVANTTALQHLLPSDQSDCVVLATTNNQRLLRGRAELFEVDVLSMEDSTALLRHKLGADQDRIESEAAGVQQVINLVDGHPLALELIASSVEYLTFQEYARELEDEQTRLDYLADWDDVNKNIKGVFQLSFKRLA